jgi:hypothetical protein
MLYDIQRLSNKVAFFSIFLVLNLFAGEMTPTERLQKAVAKEYDSAMQLKEKWSKLVKQGADPFAPAKNGVNAFVTIVKTFVPRAVLPTVQFGRATYEEYSREGALLSDEAMRTGILKTVRQLIQMPGESYNEFDLIVRIFAPQKGISLQDVNTEMKTLGGTIDKDKLEYVENLLMFD